VRLAFLLNGEQFETEATGSVLLLDLIRGCGLWGTREGCGVGVCGACTVLVDGDPVSSCIYLAGCAQGREVWTVEGVARREPDLVEAFIEHEGLQCGACTSGQLVMAAALRARGKDPGEAAVREFLAGNLCRCTGYRSIVESVRATLGS